MRRREITNVLAFSCNSTKGILLVDLHRRVAELIAKDLLTIRQR